jgi:hypothetical protein
MPQRTSTFYIAQRRKAIGLTHTIEVFYIRGDSSGFITEKKVTIMCSRFIRLQIVQGKPC